MNGLFAALYFLISTLMEIYIFVLLMRLLLQFFGGSYHNSVIQVITRATDPVIVPLRSVLPRVGGIDLATLLVLVLAEAAKIILLYAMQSGSMIAVFSLIISVLTELINATINIYVLAIVARVLLSWVNPSLHNELTDILYALTEPLLRSIRQYVPAMAGLDLSPLIAIVCLKALGILVFAQLSAL